MCGWRWREGDNYVYNENIRYNKKINVRRKTQKKIKFLKLNSSKSVSVQIS